MSNESLNQALFGIWGCILEGCYATSHVKYFICCPFVMRVHLMSILDLYNRELIYASDDVTRSSPFFWAFRRAFPDSSDQIFGITDMIPAPIKMVGPATQTIDVDSSARPVTGTLVSRVKVATLGGVATSIMTTRCNVLSAEGLDGLCLKVITTKPEDSTILQKLGPLGELVNSSSPPFPSGEALESAAPGSSEVVMRTTYCDEGLRITRNEDRLAEDVFVWKRNKFGSGNTVSL